MEHTSDTEFEIRFVDAGDITIARDLLALFASVFDEPETYSASPPTDDYLVQQLSSGAFIMVVALVDSTVVGGFGGYVLTKFEQERSEVFIYDLAVVSEFRRRGIATALIEKAKELARQRGAHLVWIQSESDDLPSSRTYQQYVDPLKANHYEFSPETKKRDV